MYTAVSVRNVEQWTSCLHALSALPGSLVLDENGRMKQGSHSRHMLKLKDTLKISIGNWTDSTLQNPKIHNL